MHSRLVTPPDLVDTELHSVLLVDPEQTDLDAVVRFCQHADRAFSVYVYTPNMNNQAWLDQAAAVCDAVVVNARSHSYKALCLLEKTYYYGDCVYLENNQKIHDPLQYFASQMNLDK